MSATSKAVFNFTLVLLLYSTIQAQQVPQPFVSQPGSGVDSIFIKWPRTEWFGKGKLSLGDYGTARYRTGISSSSNKVIVDGREVLLQKTPVRTSVMDSSGATFQLEGTKYWSAGYWVEDRGGLQIAGELLNLPEGVTNSESYMGDEMDIEILEAEISHSTASTDRWNFYLKRQRSSGKIKQELDAYISNGTRIIGIAGPVVFHSAETDSTSYGPSFYEIQENGNVIAWVSRDKPAVYFPVQTPLFSKSLVLAVVIAMGL